MTSLSRVSILFIGLFAIVPGAWADSAKAPPVRRGPAVSIQGYAQQNPDCRAWTDGCVLCTSDGSGHSQCSTPGIACQPHGLTCKSVVRAK